MQISEYEAIQVNYYRREEVIMRVAQHVMWYIPAAWRHKSARVQKTTINFPLRLYFPGIKNARNAELGYHQKRNSVPLQRW
jgi:hypothetical protein